MAAPGSSGRIAGLDGLRAVAALAVFCVHYNQLTPFEARAGPFDLYSLMANGEIGVALFFALSGFLLAQPFWRALIAGGPAPGLGVYGLRRAARILPAYYAALTLLIASSGLWRFAAAWPDILLHYAFLFNFAEFTIFAINKPFWTLAVEVQFYALLPLLFMVLRKAAPGHSPALYAALVLGLAIAAQGAHYMVVEGVTRIIPWPLNPMLTWIRPHGAVVTHSTLGHLPHFLIGVAAVPVYVAAMARRSGHGLFGPGSSEAMFWLALTVVVALAATGLGDDLAVPYGRYFLPGVPLLLAVMIVTAPLTRWARRLLDGFPLRRLGALSYGFYIYHLPCLLLVDRLMTARGADISRHWALFGVLALALSVAVAALSHYAVERPVLRWARRRAGRGGATPIS